MFVQVHEAQRVIGDRMWDPDDVAWLRSQLEDRLSGTLNTQWADLFEPYGGDCPPFVNFMRPGMEAPPYEPVADGAALKALLTEKLEDYGMEPGHSAMDLVLFRDALLHLCRISRVLAQPRGNALLVGVGAPLFSPRACMHVCIAAFPFPRRCVQLWHPKGPALEVFVGAVAAW